MAVTHTIIRIIWIDSRHHRLFGSVHNLAVGARCSKDAATFFTLITTHNSIRNILMMKHLNEKSTVCLFYKIISQNLWEYIYITRVRPAIILDMGSANATLQCNERRLSLAEPIPRMIPGVNKYDWSPTTGQKLSLPIAVPLGETWIELWTPITTYVGPHSGIEGPVSISRSSYQYMNFYWRNDMPGSFYLYNGISDSV